MFRRGGVFACVAAWSLALTWLLAATDPAALLKRADAPHDAFPEGVVRMRVSVNEHGKPPVVSLLDLFVKGSDASLCVFLEGKQQGRRILTEGDRVWLIVPGAKKPVPVSKTQRLMGAAAFGDVARLRFAADFEATLEPQTETVPSDRGDVSCHVMKLTAKRRGAPYPTATLWIGREDGLARKLRLKLASGKDAKEILFTAYRPDHRVEAMEIRDLLGGGGENVTSVSFVGYERRTLDATIFTPEGARLAGIPVFTDHAPP
jgi:hypothetical protein